MLVLAALGVDPLEVAHQKAAEIDRPGRNRRPAHDRGAVLAAEPLQVAIELGPLQDLIESATEGVRRVSLPRAGIAPQGGLFGFALAEGHASIVKSKHSVVKMFYWCTARDFIRGLLTEGRASPHIPPASFSSTFAVSPSSTLTHSPPGDSQSASLGCPISNELNSR